LSGLKYLDRQTQIENTLIMAGVTILPVSYSLKPVGLHK